MTDRELLEAAAKAAGIEGEWEAHPDYVGVSTSGIYIEGRAMLWNPLTDDGDALRLAVKLRMDVVQLSSYVRATAPDAEDCREYYGRDRYAAVRRAIVRAAAAMVSK